MIGGLRLTDLDARFVRISEMDGLDVRAWVYVEAMAQAQGVQFLCPKCFVKNGGKRGTHQVICWSRSRGVPDTVRPGPGRWALKGSSIDDLTLDGESGNSRSVQLKGGCAWHGYVTTGVATDA